MIPLSDADRLARQVRTVQLHHVARSGVGEMRFSTDFEGEAQKTATVTGEFDEKGGPFKVRFLTDADTGLIKVDGAGRYAAVTSKALQ